MLQGLYDANLAALRDGKRLNEVRGISFTYPPMTPTRFNLGSVSIVTLLIINKALTSIASHVECDLVRYFCCISVIYMYFRRREISGFVPCIVKNG